MFVSALLTLAAFVLPAAPPPVTAGPGLSAEATVIEAPISAVTVFSDRARVTRSASPPVKDGISTLRLPDLPGAVLLDTVRVTAKGGRVLRIEVTPVERERVSIEQVEKALEQIEQLSDQLASLERRAEVADLELQLLSSLAPKPAAAEGERLGKLVPPILPAVWQLVLDFVDARRDKARARLRELSATRRDLVERLQKLQREAERFNTGGASDQRIEVVAIVEVSGTPRVGLEIEYFVPGAYWLPAYDVYFDTEAGRVAMKSAGLVTQATGEDWDGVHLELSTAIPGQGIELPELLTWTLGEKKDFVPQATAARMPPSPPRFGAPVAQPTLLEADRAARQQVLAERLGQLSELVGMDASGLAATLNEKSLDALDGTLALAGSGEGFGFAGLGISGGGYGSGSAAAVGGASAGRVMAGKKRDVTVNFSSGPALRKSKAPERPRPSAPPPPPSMASSPSMAPAPMMSPGAADEEYDRSVRADYGGVTVAESAPTAVGGLGRGRRGPTTRNVSLGLYEPEYFQAPSFGDPRLPAVAAGGLDFVYTCPTAASIPSTGAAFRVPLASDNYPAETYYEATPALMTTAFFKAVVDNNSGRPVLGGDVNIFVGKDFTGQGNIRTTGAGGKLELPLGADEDIRLLRTVVPTTTSEGVFSKSDVTTYGVRLEVGNYKKRSIRLRLVDSLPLSGHEDIETQLLSVAPAPVQQAVGDAYQGSNKNANVDGILRWDLTIPAGKTQILNFSYRIKRPANWQLYGR